LERVAEYCENNYFQCANKRAALEETKGWVGAACRCVECRFTSTAQQYFFTIPVWGLRHLLYVHNDMQNDMHAHL
jgi:hypothetical protein